MNNKNSYNSTMELTIIITILSISTFCCYGTHIIYILYTKCAIDGNNHCVGAVKTMNIKECGNCPLTFNRQLVL